MFGRTFIGKQHLIILVQWVFSIFLRSISTMYFDILMKCKKSLENQKCNQNPYIEEEQTTQWSKEKG